jgi:lysophospholipase L1-like esterase
MGFGGSRISIAIVALASFLMSSDVLAFDPSRIFKKQIAADDPSIEYVGRVDHSNPKSPRFDWPGITIRARFTGRSIGVYLKDAAKGSGPEYGNTYNVWIDGVAQPVLTLDPAKNFYVLAKGLKAGEHDVKIVKRTEADFGISTFSGFEIDFAAKVLPPVREKRFKIEVVGDSLVCGYGVEASQVSCQKLRPYEDVSKAYGALIAGSVGADVMLSAASGRGMVRNWAAPGITSPDPLPFYYPRTLFNDASIAWDFSSWQPDVVVVGLGTNDFSTKPQPPKDVFLGGYRSFLETVRKNYPRARIVLANKDLDPTVDYVHELSVEQSLPWTSFGPFGLGEVGCDWHPNVTSQRKIADTILPLVREALGLN